MIAINKKYRTRDGREVRIYATDGGGGTAIHGAIKECSGRWRQESWWSNGQLLSSLQSDSDLIEVRPRHKRTVWLSMFHHNVMASFTREGAKANGYGRIACIRVELDFEEGEGL